MTNLKTKLLTAIAVLMGASFAQAQDDEWSGWVDQNTTTDPKTTEPITTRAQFFNTLSAQQRAYLLSLGIDTEARDWEEVDVDEIETMADTVSQTFPTLFD